MIRPEDRLEVTWLCQGGFLLVIRGFRLVIDPYLSNSLLVRGLDRMVPIPVKIENLKPDYVCFTHDHADHFDTETVTEIVRMYSHCRFIGPTSTFNHFVNLGFDPALFTVLDNRDVFANDIFTINAIQAFHTDKYAIGLVICWGTNRSLYISGDTEYDKDIVWEISKVSRQTDVAFVCINGKLGNMNADEALVLIKELKPALAIPMHYGLFAQNTTDPLPFVEAVNQNGIKCMELIAGVLIVV